MGVHIVSKKVYFATFAALLVLLVMTVAVSFLHMGILNMVVTLTIATIKALLVMLFFMHLRYTGYLSWAVAGAGLIWLAIMFTLTLCDYLSRTWLTAS